MKLWKIERHGRMMFVKSDRFIRVSADMLVMSTVGFVGRTVAVCYQIHVDVDGKERTQTIKKIRSTYRTLVGSAPAV